MIKWREPAKKNMFPLTHPQKRIWYTEQMNPDTGLCNIGGFMRIKGSVDPLFMEQAVIRLYERNDALRLKLIDDDGEYKQYLRDVEEYSLIYHDFSNDEDSIQVAYRWMEDETAKLFPSDQVFECILLKLADDDFIWYLKCHHIISDGWTCVLLVRDLDICYQQALTGVESEQSAPPSYLDYIGDELEYKSSKRFQKNRAFWIENLSDVSRAVTLSFKRQISRSVEGRRYSLFIDQSTTDHLKEYVAESGASVYGFFMTVLFTYMYRITGEKDMVIGTPVLNRSSARLKKTAGMFVSTMPFRVEISDNLTFAEFLKMILHSQMRYYRNQQYPMDILVKDLQLAQKGNNKMFDISLSYQNSSTKESFNGSPTEFGWIFNGCEENSLTIHINEWMNQGTLRIDFDYAIDVFEQQDIEKIGRHFVNITKQVLNESNLPLYQIDYMDQQEKDLLLSWNNTQIDYPKEKTITQLFEEQVERTPNKIAVVFEGQELTYRELNEKANQLARVLRAKGVSRDQAVGLMVDKSLEMIIGVLAIIKAGGAYLPIDIDYPENRVEYMLNDSQARIILTHQDTIPGVNFNEEVINLFNSQYNNQDVTNLEQVNQAHDLIYIIYTSGSTGKPKGVMIEHQNVNRLISNSNMLIINENDRILQTGSLAFDASTFEIWGSLLNGACLYLNSRNDLLSAQRFEERLKENQITMIWLTAPLFNQLLEENPAIFVDLKTLIVGGDALSVKHINKLRNENKELRIINGYGPTESTTFTTYFRIDQEYTSNIPIGKPVSNTKVYILDKNSQLQPIGVPGELCIAGDGLARGYLNKPKLTEEKFVKSPFGERIYRSGDLARWLPDGNIEFLGRIDNQVKIRGFRIELGEIENQLLSHDKIREAIVVDKVDSNNKYLCAYIVSDGELSVADLREHLTTELPDYMIPSYFISLNQMPLNSNGKIDCKALPEIDGNISIGTEYVAPKTETEVKIAKIWSEILRIERVGINDNFFELGGDSIKAIQILAKANQVDINLTVKDIFRYKTIANLVKNVDFTKTKRVVSQEEVSGEVLLTPIQKWFFMQKLTDQHHFNQSNLFSLKADVDLDLLQEVFKKIIKHHDTLRMGYRFYGEQIVQFNRRNDEVEFKIQRVDLSHYEYAVQKEKLSEIATKMQSNFDLEKDLLIKAVVFDLGDHGKRLLIPIHHLIIDGVSWRILLEDIETLYNSDFKKELPLKTTSFKEWSQRLNCYAENETVGVEYWDRIDPSQINLLTQCEVKDNYLRDHKSLLIELDKEQTEKLLTKVNWAYNTEINDILLSALVMSITEGMGIENLLINLEGHGREEILDDIDLSRTIGWFTSAYPVYLQNQVGLEKTIKHVKENLRRIPQKGLNFGITTHLQNNEKLQALKPKISFNYLGQFGGSLEDENAAKSCLRGCKEDGGSSLSFNNQHPYLIDINGSIINGILQLSMSYNGQYLDDELLNQIQSLYVHRLSEIIDHCVNKTERTYTISDFGVENLINEKDFDVLAQNFELEKVKMYGLTPMQEGMLFHSLLNKEGNNYYEQISYYIEGNLDIDQFKEAWQEVINRHEVFRTCFVWEKLETAIQVILSEALAEINQSDISLMNSADQIAYINQLKEKDLENKFDLAKGKLNRILIVKLSAEKYWICWTFHHIILDGWSLPIVLDEFFDIYHRLVNNLELPPEPVAQFGDYLEWLRKQDKNKSLGFWQSYLENLEEPTYLPADKKSSQVIAKAISREIVFDKEKTCQINDFCRENNITMNALIQTVWGIVLQKYNNTDQSCFGMTVSGRPAEFENVESIVGIFINTLPVVVQTTEHATIKEILTRVNNELVEIREYEHVPLAEIQKLHDHFENLFESLIVFENYPANFVELGRDLGFNISLDSFYDLTNYDLTMVVIANEKLSLKQVYNAEVFELDTIERIEGSIVQLIETILISSEQLVSGISLVSEEDKKQLLFDFNDTKVDYPISKTIQQLFEEQVLRTPNQTAVIFEDQKLTYRELNEKANQLARLLRAKGVGSDQMVGMMLNRSLEMIIGVLAILKAGGAYLPIDPDYPADRIEFTLDDSGTEILLTERALVETIQFNHQMICLDDLELYQGETSNLENVNQPEDLAYIIYTSGTTGRPKGVMIEHRNVVRLLFNDKFQFDFSEKDTWTMFHSYCFDFSVWEMYGALLFGGRLIVIPKRVARDPEKFLEILKQEQVTVLNQTPSAFYNLIHAELKEQDQRLQVRYVIFGGEALNPIKLKDWKEKYPTTQLINMYGITETTVHVTFKEITDHEIEHNISNIGKPIPTLTTYVMDANLKLLPIGVSGELCVGGDGVARGYVNRPELTETKFVTNPYKPEERIYRSGDLVRMLPNGEMEYLGRIDHQVKIRGFRIELGEIESNLLNHPEISEAIVMARENENSDKYLCAYFMANQQTDVADLRKYLSKDLPDYMIPAYFVQLDEIPLTSNGKVNRKALPEPNHEINHGEEYVAPRNDVEEALVQVWQEVLGVKQVGINDNFFALGGDSIKAIQISSRLQRYNLKLEMQKLFQNPNIADLSDYVQDITTEMDQSTVEGEANLTPIQHWFFARNLTKQHHFNQSLVFFNEKGFNENWIAQVFLKIVEHHDALRMIYQIEGSEIRQNNQGIGEKLFDLNVYDFKNEDHYELLINEETGKLHGSIDLITGPMVKLGLFQTSVGDYLLVAIHHLVVDGVSWRILFEDFATGYLQLAKGEEIRFPLKTTSYREWAEQLNNYANSEELLQEMSYWRQLEEVELVSLPRDHQITTDLKKDSRFVTVSLSSEETEQLLKEVNRAYNTEINDILLAALAATLREWSQEEKVLITLEGHGREEIIEDVDINRTIGWFTSIYPVLIDLQNKVNPGEIIKGTKESLRAIPNKGIGYGILKYLTSDEYKQEMKFTLHPEVSFNYLGQLDQDVNTEVFSLADIARGQDMNLNDKRSNVLDINGIIKDDRLVVNVDYNQNEYEASTITGFMNSFIDYLRQMIVHCLGKEETELTLSDFSDQELDEEELEDIFSDLEELFEV